jgi:hypothetical protein
MKSITKMKISLSLLTWALYLAVITSFQPTLTNGMAITQLETSSSSFTDYSMYQSFIGYSWVIPVVITIALFFNNIKNLIKKLK